MTFFFFLRHDSSISNKANNIRSQKQKNFGENWPHSGREVGSWARWPAAADSGGLKNSTMSNEI